MGDLMRIQGRIISALLRCEEASIPAVAWKAGDFSWFFFQTKAGDEQQLIVYDRKAGCVSITVHLAQIFARSTLFFFTTT
jgi:hypothetical protein